MDAQTTSTLVTAVGGTAGGALTAGWVAKLLIKRFIDRNDKQHDQSAQGLKQVADTLADIATELAVIRTTLGQVSALKDRVEKDHDIVVELRTWNTKYKDDLAAQFGKLRHMDERIEDVCKLISSLRREAK